MKKLMAVAIFVLFAGACSAETPVDTDAVAATFGNDQNGGQQNSQSNGGSDAPSADGDAPADNAPPPTVDTGSQAAQIGSDDWCTAATQIEANFEELDLIDFTDPEALEGFYTQQALLLAQVQAIAPPAIAGDVAQISQGFAVINEALAAAGWNFLNVDQSVFAALDTQMETATFNIEKYNFDICGIGDDPGSAPGLQNGSTQPPPAPEPPAAEQPAAPAVPAVPDLTGGAIGEQIIANFVAQGFTEAEATCILGGLDLNDPEALADFNALFGVFTNCGIPLERLAEIGAAVGG